MIKIINQGYISELGKRANNEDNCAFIKGSTYVVCDGVGGSEKGEIASDIVSKYFVESYDSNPLADANVILKNAEAKLSNYIANNPDAMGMATTLTFSQVRDNGIYVAWVGDSRIYQFRKGQIIFRSTDHSWVNDALKAGIITEEEAVNHPKSNIITKAVQGNHKSTSADTRLLTDIQKGDLFFQCSDGILETWNDDDLQALFLAINDPDKILEKLKMECEQYSKDNFTAIVYRIEEASIVRNTNSTDNYVNAIPVINNNGSAKSNSNYKEHIAEPKPTLKGLLNLKILGVRLVLWVVILISLIIAFNIKNLIPSKEDKGKEDKDKAGIGVAILSNDLLTDKEKNKIISEVYESIDENLEDQGYSKKKIDINNDQIEKEIAKLSKDLKNADTIKDKNKKDNLKNSSQEKIKELNDQLDKQKDFIKLNDSITYYKKK
jgi:serine/threonine protein phosphatase PrpC